MTFQQSVLSLVASLAIVAGVSCRDGEKTEVTKEPAPAAAAPTPTSAGAPPPGAPAAQDKAVVDRVVEAGCGECQFGLEGDGCDLAVRIDGKAYWVDGTDIGYHGDAHADDGFCNATRPAKVSGTIHGDRFTATSFELTAEPASSKDSTTH